MNKKIFILALITIGLLFQFTCFDNNNDDQDNPYIVDSYPKADSTITMANISTFYIEFKNPIDPTTLSYLANYYVQADSVCQWDICGTISLSEGDKKVTWTNGVAGNTNYFSSGKNIEILIGTENTSFYLKDIYGNKIPQTKIKFSIE